MTRADRYENRTDQELADQASRGNWGAFAALYRRSFEGVYDFAVRVSREPELASKIVHSTYVETWWKLREGGIQRNFKAWLYTQAYRAAATHPRLKKRIVANGESASDREQLPTFIEFDGEMVSGPGAVEDRALPDLVWRSAAALPPYDYALLHLYLRQSLPADELAAVFNLRKGQLYKRLSRLTESLEDSVITSLLIHHGREDCLGLAGFSTQIRDSGLDPGRHAPIQVHIKTCARCQESKRRYPSATEIFAGLPLVPAPQRLKHLIAKRLSNRFAGGRRPHHRRPSRAGTFAAIAFVLLAELMVCGGVSAMVWQSQIPPLRIADPSDVHSLSHRVGQSSPENIIAIGWSMQPEAAGYSVLWSEQSADLPDTRPNLLAGANGIVSPVLEDGSWYFHLRTMGWDGSWTSTVHLGPFTIDSTPATTPRPSATLSSVVSNTATPTPTPIPTDLPTLTPTAEQTSVEGTTLTLTPIPAWTPTPSTNACDNVASPGLKVAFIGDQGLGTGARAVLKLIKCEGADMVLHQGDFDYRDNPDRWDQQISDILGPDFPYFASIGNHDTAAWSGYQAKLGARLTRVQGAWCSGDLGVKSACYYRGLFFILSGAGTRGSGHTEYIQLQLAQDDSIWSICSWHKNQREMQVGGKWSEVGWGPYEACREEGAIVATGHEHSYSRTFLMDSFENQVVANTSNTLQLERGRSFVFVSGLGGKSIRDQNRSDPWWAAIYTSDQGANHGALFCIFFVGGQPDRASCYFKDIDGVIPDRFELISAVQRVVPTPTTAPAATETQTPTPSPTIFTTPTPIPTSAPTATEEIVSTLTATPTFLPTSTLEPTDTPSSP